MVCHQIRLRGDDSFSNWLKKKGIRYLLSAYMGMDFLCKTMHSRDA